MFTLSTLKTGLKGWIGFRDSDDPSIPRIDTALVASGSGQYFDDFHELLYTDAMYYASPNYEGMNFSAYSAVPTYGAGDKVISSNIPWQSKVASNQGNTPAVGAYWETMFSVWLGEKVDASVAMLFNKLATSKKLSGSTKSIFSNLQLFMGAGKLSDTITKSSRLVGLSIQPKNINNIQVVLNQIGLQFTTAQTGLIIYLWHSSRKAAYKSQAVTTTGTGQFHWVSLTDFICNFVDFTNDIDPGGTWFIGYFEADIAGNAVRKTYDFYTGPCIGCSDSASGNITKYNLWSKYVDIMPFTVTNADLDGVNLPAIEDMTYDETTNFGLNLSLTVRPDLTEMIIDNKNLISYPLGMQFARDMLSWMAFNPSVRINPSANNAGRDVILYELDGATDTQADSVKVELGRAIDALAADLSNISAALPANKPSGIKIGAI